MMKTVVDTRYRPTYVEVDLNTIKSNTEAVSAYAKDNQMGLIGVVKADAYGHGAPQVAKAIIQGGARMLAVALVEEGIALREAGIDVPILVMGAVMPGSGKAYAQYNLTASIGDFSELTFFTDELNEAGGRVNVHIKVDTGMSRLGILPEQVLSLAQLAASQDSIHLEGIYSHFATADDVDTKEAQKQFELFEDVLCSMEQSGQLPTYRHIVNSPGLLGNFSGKTNMARVGLLLYGLYPGSHLTKKIRLEPALSWKSRVATAKRVPAGTSVGYGHTYHVASETTLVTLPVGYADGFWRGLSSKADVLIRGRRYKVAGRICMDQTIVDVGDDDVAPGDEVILLGRQGNERVTTEEWAKHLGTINYEIIPSISKRVPRIYVGEIGKGEG